MKQVQQPQTTGEVLKNKPIVRWRHVEDRDTFSEWELDGKVFMISDRPGRGTNTVEARALWIANRRKGITPKP